MIAILDVPRRNGFERIYMILAHFIGFRGHAFGTGILLLLVVLACAFIIATWPEKKG
jgi:hypothetical protein